MLRLAPGKVPEKYPWFRSHESKGAVSGAPNTICGGMLALTMKQRRRRILTFFLEFHPTRRDRMDESSQFAA
jgi:hypothetical protein